MSPSRRPVQTRLTDERLARASVAECLSMKPDFSTNRFVSKLPFKVAADTEQLAASLHLAGLPD